MYESFGIINIVIVDPETGQPYTRKFDINSNHKDYLLRSIIIDDENIWAKKSAEVITTKLSPSSQEQYDAYAKKLQKEAAALYAKAKNEGLLNSIRDGILPEKLASYLDSQLRLISQERCDESPATGMYDLHLPFRCRAALRERNIITTQGYSITPNFTPLSTIVVINKIQHDLR